MKTPLGILAGLALVALSACNWNASVPPGEKCPDFAGLPADGSPVMCGDDAFEALDGGIAWRDIPESEPCPTGYCDDIEIVAIVACPRIYIDFREGSATRDGWRSRWGELILNASIGTRYAFRVVSQHESVSAVPESVACWYPD